jgi:hypothetical protein
MKTHGFQEHKLRAQRKMVCNRIWRQVLPPLKNSNNREAFPSTRDDKISAPKKWKPQQQVQQLAKFKKNKPVNNHEEVQLKL